MERYLVDMQKAIDEMHKTTVGKCLGTCKHCGRKFIVPPDRQDAEKVFQEMIIHGDSHSGTTEGRDILDRLKATDPDILMKELIDNLNPDYLAKFAVKGGQG